MVLKSMVKVIEELWLGAVAAAVGRYAARVID
jgi:hypothetical protein